MAMTQEQIREALHSSIRLMIQKSERERVARERLAAIRTMAVKDEGELYAEKLVRVSEARLQHAGTELNAAIDGVVTTICDLVASATEEVTSG